MRFILVIFLIAGFWFNNQSENYIEYHQIFGQIEALIVNEKFSEAELKIEELFNDFEVKFVKDYVVASQVSLLNKNKKLALKYIDLSIKNGVKVECLKSIDLLNQEFTTADWKQIEQAYKAARKEYLKRIDLKLYQEFHKRYQKEQDAKRTDNYKLIVYNNFNRIKELLNQQDFIGVKMAGIDNERFAKSISDCNFGNSKIIVTLLHYDYPINEIGEERLIDAIKKGNLHPREFGVIYNYQVTKQSVLYRKSEKEYSELPVYNFNLPFGDKINNLKKVNADRAKFGICNYEVDLKKKEISEKYGLQLSFSY